jgi:hypothetical protein
MLCGSPLMSVAQCYVLDTHAVFWVDHLDLSEIFIYTWEYYFILCSLDLELPSSMFQNQLKC